MKYCYLALFVFCLACQRTPNSEVASQTFNPKPGQSYVLFLNFRFYHTDKYPKATYENHIIAEGKLKPQSAPPTIRAPYLILQLLNNNQETLKEIPLTNPLIKNVEYVEDSGSLARKTITLEQAELTIRLQLPNETNQIVLWYILGSNERIELNRKWL
jgi:hypothetical protein